MTRHKYEWPISLLTAIEERGYKTPRSFALTHGIDAQRLYVTAREKANFPSVAFMTQVARALGMTVPEALAVVWPHVCQP